MDYEMIEVRETTEGIGVIILNRPEKRNALSIRLRSEIAACLDGWSNDEKMSVVVLSGAGPVFSAGFDLKEFRKPELTDEILRSSSRYHQAVWGFPKPTIAAINGPALAGGLDLAALCDIRICAPGAVFGHPEVKFGAPPLYTPLRWIIGSGPARELCFTGRTIDAEEALRIGLVSEVIVDDDVVDRGVSLARTIQEAPLPTLEITKNYMNDNEGKGFDESFTEEHDIAFEKFLQQKKKDS